ncbi:catabolite repressor/activator [Testudinibacter sp. TR-2022]|uniref:catabolite repressor/activator n=1 Tax=Testudinibacter sp. TR-2022 TaxID=2585029 RepID=UPI00111BB48A|nr:catabolite repressor/activator [Testudinibacter sp. TR-2022]TNH04444.1 catabolite repressor/activator [Pasteurellaceae bacterium Phil31]TNH08881.1 catabolite repressor/activator [Testudinibacter sp. TR-2022]TNH12034.1 catabolite repressor/activator [Testudinibacter sp. TR-2022]TNH14419.1 catabolite repressor/activator [Testudinibacter sp. TR-2022]TNH17392.1 catabolite repressor/activator [Testudinibacter sp. TR-2022]
MKLDEIAKLAGVSRTTASYVINGKAKQFRVSDRTIDKVMAVVNAHNFKPNPVAASLRAGHTNTIGLIVPDLENISYAKIAMRFEALCRHAGYQLFISCSNDDAENEKACAIQLLARKIDALVVSTALSTSDDFYQRVKNIPIIGFDRKANNLNNINILYHDQEDSRHLAAQLLQSSQPQSILYFGAQRHFPISQERELGFRQVLQQHTLNTEYLYAPHFSRESAMQVFGEWLQHNCLPDVIFITSLTLLQGVFQVLLQQQGRIPPQLTIATFGDQQMLELLPNPVISAVQPYQKIAESLLNAVQQTTAKKKKSALNYPVWIEREIFIKTA